MECLSSRVSGVWGGWAEKRKEAEPQEQGLECGCCGEGVWVRWTLGRSFGKNQRRRMWGSYRGSQFGKGWIRRKLLMERNWKGGFRCRLTVEHRRVSERTEGARRGQSHYACPVTVFS